jgi:hypothetical protein
LCYIKITHNGGTFSTSKRETDGRTIRWDWPEGFDIKLESLNDEILIEFKIEDKNGGILIGWEKASA